MLIIKLLRLGCDEPPFCFSLQIRPVIHKVFKFEEMSEAFETLEKGHLRGKIVVDFD